MILGKFFKDRRLWLITIAVFILVITVFDKNNLIEAWRLKQKINELEVSGAVRTGTLSDETRG